jgi:membrane dipeptidase
MLFFDAHLDLAMNAVEYNRDLTQPLATIRAREAHLRDRPDRGRGTVCLPELRRGGFGIVVATLIARVELGGYSPAFGWNSPAQAWAMTQAQFAWYRAMEEAGEMTAIRNRAELDAHATLWQGAPSLSSSFSSSSTSSSSQSATGKLPIGYLLSLEGADSLITLDHLDRLAAAGLRAIGPAHYGEGRYAFGTTADGPFPPRGRELLRHIARLGLILDVTHLCDECFWEAMELHAGPLWASHQNTRALVPHCRQFSDEQIRAVIARGGVLGLPFDAWMIVPGWERGKTTPASSGVTLQHAADHLDHICQLAGNARHVGLGTDLDGGFGTEQTPGDLDSIADLQNLFEILRARGYSEEDLLAIAHGNFLAFLRKALPE